VFQQATSRVSQDSVMSISPEFAAGAPDAFPDALLYLRTCEGGSGGRCVAACPPGAVAISGGHDRPIRALGLAYPVDADAWGVTMPEDGAGGAVTVWVMCI
jgi:hypothetical protein